VKCQRCNREFPSRFWFKDEGRDGVLICTDCATGNPARAVGIADGSTVGIADSGTTELANAGGPPASGSGAGGSRTVFLRGSILCSVLLGLLSIASLILPLAKTGLAPTGRDLAGSLVVLVGAFVWGTSAAWGLRRVTGSARTTRKRSAPVLILVGIGAALGTAAVMLLILFVVISMR